MAATSMKAEGKVIFPAALEMVDGAILERLAEHLKGRSSKLGKFVKKKDTVVGQADFTGPRVGSPSEKSDIRNGVVGRSKGASCDESQGPLQHSTGAVNLRCRDRFILGHGRHNCGNPFGEHRFAGSWRPRS